ncbi:hypothetical protein [Niveispirillum cyanobacteriorum]|uniref:Uncharacterized protein n=1 Tax=Niveispirillum cyanobacteriorum TaxID=1612173 RepID=A0A2K9NAG4_9PROT|nr:hypothetical protein [Niveispirillum cyanobacteriorum]AUN30131.1 hypothetical protein C0V82_07725 [Niveispirillum cyanobacteriorum]GGE57654.1 hypothetical protein GCM10011317_14460 [Niveispirillum cyanobacteriorum]
MISAELSYIVLGVTPAIAAACRTLAGQGGCFTIMDSDQRAGHRLVLELNTGSRGRAIFVPGNPEEAGDRADAMAENARCWPDQTPLILSPASL